MERTAGRLAWLWVLSSAVAVYILHALPPQLLGWVGALWGVAPTRWQTAVHYWFSPEWVVAVASFAIGLGAIYYALRRRKKYSAMWAIVGGTLAYLLAASAMLMDFTAGPSQASNTIALVFVTSLFVYWNAWVPLLVPLLVGLVLRRSIRGSGQEPVSRVS